MRLDHISFASDHTHTRKQMYDNENTHKHKKRSFYFSPILRFAIIYEFCKLNEIVKK